MPRRPHVAVVIRFPPELHGRLVALAEGEHRSLTAEVIHLLEGGAARAEQDLRGRLEQERAQRAGQGDGNRR